MDEQLKIRGQTWLDAQEAQNRLVGNEETVFCGGSRVGKTDQLKKAVDAYMAQLDHSLFPEDEAFLAEQGPWNDRNVLVCGQGNFTFVTPPKLAVQMDWAPTGGGMFDVVVSVSTFCRKWEIDMDDPHQVAMMFGQMSRWMAEMDKLCKMHQPVDPPGDMSNPVPDDYPNPPDLQEYIQQRATEESRKKAMEKSIIESHRSLRDLFGL